MAAMEAEARVRVCPAPQPGRASYQDVLDAPPHMVAEMLAGTRTPIRDRHRCMASRVRESARRSTRRSGTVMEIPVAGGSYWSRSSISATTSWCRMWQAGGAEPCPSIPERRFCGPSGLGLRGALALRPAHRPERKTLYLRMRGRFPPLVRRSRRQGTLQAFELGRQRWTLFATLAEDAPVSLPPFDGITFPLDALWLPGASSGG